MKNFSPLVLTSLILLKVKVGQLLFAAFSFDTQDTPFYNGRGLKADQERRERWI